MSQRCTRVSGYALTEDFRPTNLGDPTNMTLRKPSASLRPKDVRDRDRARPGAPAALPYGVKGVGEVGLVPTSGAVAAMLFMVDGQWRTTLPMGRGNTDADSDS